MKLVGLAVIKSSDLSRTHLNRLLENGFIQEVMKWTGHSDYKAMKPYIKLADKVKANAMDKFNKL